MAAPARNMGQRIAQSALRRALGELPADPPARAAERHLVLLEAALNKPGHAYSTFFPLGTTPSIAQRVGIAKSKLALKIAKSVGGSAPLERVSVETHRRLLALMEDPTSRVFASWNAMAAPKSAVEDYGLKSGRLIDMLRRRAELGIESSLHAP